MDRKNNHTIILILMSLGLFMTSIDTSMLRIAIPDLIDEFSVSVSFGALLIAAYLAAYVGFISIFGVLSDTYGSKYVILGGILLFMISAFCNLHSSSVFSLFFYRMLQAIGASALSSASLVVLKEHYPEEKIGRALGVYGSAAGLGAILGPIVCGFISRSFHWKYIFALETVLGLMIVIAAKFMVPKSVNTANRNKSFDFLGSLLLMVSLFTILILVTLLKSFSLDENRYIVVLLMGMFVVAGICFILVESRSQEPLWQLSLIKNTRFMGGASTLFLHAFGMSAVLFTTVIYFQILKGLTPLATSLWLLPFPIAMTAAMPIGGIISDKLGRRIPAVIGGIIGFTAIVADGLVDESIHISICLFFIGIGTGLANSPLQASSMNAAPNNQTGMAISFYRILKWLGNCFGVLTAGVLIPELVTSNDSFGLIYLIIAITTGISILTSVLIESRGVAKEFILVR